MDITAETLNVQAIQSNSLSVDGKEVKPLEPATSSSLGGIKVGANLAIASDGTLSASGGSEYELSAATRDVIGGVRPMGDLYVEGDGALYVQVGEGLDLGEDYNVNLKAATSTTLGGVMPGNSTTVASDGTLEVVSNENYGMSTGPSGIRIKAGANLDFDSEGNLSAAGGGSSDFIFAQLQYYQYPGSGKGTIQLDSLGITGGTINILLWPSIAPGHAAVNTLDVIEWQGGSYALESTGTAIKAGPCVMDIDEAGSYIQVVDSNGTNSYYYQ